MQGRQEGLYHVGQISSQPVNSAAVELSAKGFKRFFDDWRHGYAGPTTSYALALGLIGLASLARWLALEVIPGSPFIFYLPVIAVVAYVGGWWPGLFAAALSVTVAFLLFVTPDGSVALGNAGATLRAVLAFLIGAAVAALIHRIRMDQLNLAAQNRRADLLLHELQHRVLNNIQLMAAIVGLEAQRSEGAREELTAVSQRLLILGQLHRRLSTLGHEQTVDFGGFAEAIAREMGGVVAAPDVELDAKLHRLEVHGDLALPLGLILAELITNAVKHGVSDGDGRVRVRLRRAQDGRYSLEVSNGQGRPAAAAPVCSLGHGLAIIRGLAEQIGAEITRSSVEGETRVEVRFAP